MMMLMMKMMMKDLTICWDMEALRKAIDEKILTLEQNAKKQQKTN